MKPDAVLAGASVGAKRSRQLRASGDIELSIARLRCISMFRVYERPPSTAGHTVAVFLVDDLEEEVSTLRSRGVSFEEYDLPGLVTEDGIFSDERSGFRGSWIKDPDGNILGLTQILRA